MQANVLFSQKAKEALLEGVMKATDAVRPTLGPRGRNVLIEQPGNFPMLPRVTKDGVTIAKSLIDLGDNILTQGARMVIDVASKTVRDTGDGTTSAMILTAEMFRDGLKTITKNTNVTNVVRGMDIACEHFIQYVESMRSNCEEKDLIKVATISANNDPFIGKIVGEAVQSVGKHGMVTTRKGGSYETRFDLDNGAMLESGMINMMFMTDLEKEMAILENPLVFISDWDISLMREEALPLFQFAMKEKRPLVIICEDMSGEALQTALYNKKDGQLKVCVVRAPYMGEMRTTALEDLSIYLGGTYFAEDKGIAIPEIQRLNPNGNYVYPLGSCQEVRISRRESRFIGGKGSPERIAVHHEMLVAKAEAAENPMEKEALMERLSRFLGMTAVIHVGGSSEADIARKTDLIDDAIHATKAALMEGVVAGGGITYLMAAEYLERQIMPKYAKNKDVLRGIEVVKNALSEPFIQILVNAGIPRRQVLKIAKKLIAINKTIAESIFFVSIDGTDLSMQDMSIRGILDPARVLMVCVDNAVSCASNLLTTEAVIYSQANMNLYQKQAKK